MWFMIAAGRSFVAAGLISIPVRFFVEPTIFGALLTATLYGGGIVGLGLVLAKMGRLGLEGGPGPEGWGGTRTEG